MCVAGRRKIQLHYGAGNDMEQPLRFLRVIFYVTGPAFSCGNIQFQRRIRSTDCDCIDNKKACI